jgi:hypothetical protein
MTLNKIFIHNFAFLLPLSLILFTGCESTPTATEQDFGASVRNMIELQTAQPGDTGLGLDGQKAEAVLDSYRQDVGKPKDVERDIIQINLGN